MFRYLILDPLYVENYFHEDGIPSRWRIDDYRYSDMPLLELEDALTHGRNKCYKSKLNLVTGLY